MAVLWRQRRWVTLLGLIDQLPSACRLREALADDEELAAAILNNPVTEPDGEWAPPVAEWDMTASLLAQLVDAQADIVRMLASIKSGIPTVQVDKLRNPPRLNTKPLPRPRTALDRLRAQSHRQAQLNIIAAFAPHALN